MATRTQPKNPTRLLTFLAVITGMAAILTVVIEHAWFGGVVVGERVEAAKSYVQLRKNNGTWVEVSNLVFSIWRWVSRIWLAGTLAITSIFVWYWTKHGHWPKSGNE